MKKKRNNLKTKKGVTIIEVVIALVLIGVIMASAISVIMMSVQVENNSSAAVLLQTSAENILECFRFAKTEEEFVQAVSKCGNYQTSGDGSLFLLGTDLVITIKSDFTENKLEFYATNSKGDEIYSFNYSKKVKSSQTDIGTGEDSVTEGESA